MNGPKCRKVSALWAITQGLLTAVVPQLSVKMMKRIAGLAMETVAADSDDDENVAADESTAAEADDTDDIYAITDSDYCGYFHRGYRKIPSQ